MSEPTATVGETRTMLGILAGIPRDHIRHYVIAMDADEGAVLKFCCDDREMAAAMFSRAATLVVTVPGEPVGGGPVLPMPAQRAQAVTRELLDAVAERNRDLEQLAAEILAAFHKTDGGHRARVGQVQIQKWHARLNPAQPWNPGGTQDGGGHGG